jgi:hypothetical protein
LGAKAAVGARARTSGSPSASARFTATRKLGRIDPHLARSANHLVVHVGDVLQARDGEAAGLQEADEEVEPAVSLSLPTWGRS